MGGRDGAAKGSKAAARARGLNGPVVARSAWGLYRETRRPGAPGLAARVRALPRLLRDVLLWFLVGLTRESGRYVEWAAARREPGVPVVES
ncbi:hypothetical protein [Kitasatospora phosalacinea]|uniref:hypothetical protein n=1 Tax=Kitasatospora phosalacinea TaxID=2065 RepID=UPI000527EC87|nr:hypothetical protein [Kitasatospora phosalacinea]